MFLRPKKQRQGIMVLEFIFLFERLNLTALTPEKNQEVMDKTGLTYKEAVEVFEYEKNNNSYLNRAKLHESVINKALLIAEALYIG